MKNTAYAIYLKLVRLWLFSFLIILPFSGRIANFIARFNANLSSLVFNLDELTVVLFLFPAIWEYYRNRKVLDMSCLLLLISPFLLICISGLISSYVNQNSLQVAVFGTFDYVKNLLAIFIYAAFFKAPNDFKKIYRILLVVGVLLGTVVLMQFLWAMGSVYIFKKSITDPAIYIFRTYNESAPIFKYWRFGIYRAPGYYYYGLYYLLILAIYLYRTKKNNTLIILPLYAGVLASASRVVYGGFVFIMVAQIIKGRKWMISLLVVILLVFIPNINDNNDLDLSMFPNLIKSDQHVNFNTIGSSVRSYSRYKSIEIWKDHPIWGVGPGMFGGIVATKYTSNIYTEYSIKRRKILNAGVEQFWFQLLAEMGIVGSLCFVNFLAILCVTMNKLKKRTEVEDIKKLYSALIAFMGCIIIYCLGSGINISLVLFTYCALVGIGLSSSNVTGKSKVNCNSEITR